MNSLLKENEKNNTNYNEYLIENLENEINLYNKKYNNYEKKDISLTNEVYTLF